MFDFTFFLLKHIQQVIDSEMNDDHGGDSNEGKMSACPWKTRNENDISRETV